MTDFDYMLEGMTRDLALMLMEKRCLSMSDALNTLYNTPKDVHLKDKAHTLGR